MKILKTKSSIYYEVTLDFIYEKNYRLIVNISVQSYITYTVLYIVLVQTIFNHFENYVKTDASYNFIT